MELQTKIKIKKSESLINYTDSVCMLGSCFSSNIGKKLTYYQFNNLQNPIGILFHPQAIYRFLERALQQREFTEKDLFFSHDLWHCFEVHSEMSAIDKTTVLDNLNSSLSATYTFLKKASHVFITLGTAWGYRNIDQDMIVANCHKQAQKIFTKELLLVSEVNQLLNGCINIIQKINSNAKVVFTVSPVRHLKDGFVENQQSKSVLIAGLMDVLKSQKANYFPAYEIMMDELRDYRFYKLDMLHPNQLAIDYIWERFISAWFSNDTIAVMKKVADIRKGMLHKPFNANTTNHKRFLELLEEKKMMLLNEFPDMDFG